MADSKSAPVLADLHVVSQALDDLVDRDGLDWSAATPAAGWTVAHQIGHLAWTDEKALVAMRTPEAFGDELRRALAGGADYVDAAAHAQARKPAAQLLAEWRAGRAALAEALTGAASDTRFPWYGPPMSVASMATARLMETWAHSLDVRAAFGLAPEAGPWLRHIARLGVRTRDFAFGVHGLTPPAAEFRVELRAPGGEWWTFGPEEAEQRLTGDALDFCLVVTQRADAAATGLVAVGESVSTWLRVAQAFAGPPGRGREAGVETPRGEEP
ncbi:TIGR03084 family metal-binding protein [Streptacidiphilus jiangxiensis]|uniref:TIGR03084 family protein n=1 Tax=Streptacidiphilus jiangxiensis TaxID=235985 RepID=A0A1H7V7B3_STRJI|nr:TIGR03084 family metal-binding protein [Streptacidiphilus jiangxiensis]SEM04798.1 TIGR03084 family protein [Streptacidiphilus jiangxiensis]